MSLLSPDQEKYIQNPSKILSRQNSVDIRVFALSYYLLIRSKLLKIDHTHPKVTASPLDQLDEGGAIAILPQGGC